MTSRHQVVPLFLCGLVMALPYFTDSQEQQLTTSVNKLAVVPVNLPEQIHLSLGANSNDVTIMWSTKYDEKGYIEYGSDPHILTRVLGAQAVLNIRSEQAARFLHRAELLNLTPGQRYLYQIISGNSGSKSRMLTFEVPHADPTKPHLFMVLADLGLLTKSLQFVVHEVLHRQYEVVFHIGDIAYNLDSEGGSLGDHYMNRVDNFTARVPYMTTPGDHESMSRPGDHENEESYYHYRHRFSMPNSVWPMTHDSLWYSIDIGYVHFISINTDLFFKQSRLNHLQREWLKKDLVAANKNRKAYPWIIVMGHKPMYCTRSVMSQDCQEDHSAMRGQLEDLFFEQGVDLYFSGHKHSYERSWPMYLSRVFQTDTINPMAPIYIIIGAMGYEYLVDQQLSDPYWLAFASTDRKKELFGKLSVQNETHLVWSVHSALNGEEVENVVIIQKYHGSFGKAGSAAFDKISKKSNNFPPEPLNIVDEPYENSFRKTILYSMVFILSLVLFMFLRHSRVRKILRL